MVEGQKGDAPGQGAERGRAEHAATRWSRADARKAPSAGFAGIFPRTAPARPPLGADRFEPSEEDKGYYSL